MPVLVALDEFAFKSPLEGATGFAEVVQQRGQGGQQVNVFTRMPIVFVVLAQDVARGGVGGHRTLAVEAAGIAHGPKQFAVIEPAYPVTRHGSIFAGCLAKQLAQGVESLFRNRGLPRAVTASFAKLVKDAPGFR